MKRRNVFIAVEDVYAVQALRELLTRHCPEAVDRVVVRHLPPCSGKMTRIIRGHLEQGSHVIILVDAEAEDPDRREEYIRNAHRLRRDRVDVIVFDPCIEAPLCEALGLRNCRLRPCGSGPLESVREYWRRVHHRDYEKRLLVLLLREADSRGGLCGTVEFSRLFDVLRRVLGGC